MDIIASTSTSTPTSNTTADNSNNNGAKIKINININDDEMGGENNNNTTMRKRGNEHLLDQNTKQTKKRQEEKKGATPTPTTTTTTTDRNTTSSSTSSSAILYCQQVNENENENENENLATTEATRTRTPLNAPNASRVVVNHTAKPVASHHSVLPLSMQIMKPFWVMCCQTCERTRNGRRTAGTNGNNNNNNNNSNNLANEHHPYSSFMATSSSENNATTRVARESRPSFIDDDGHVIMGDNNNNNNNHREEEVIGDLSFPPAQYQPLLNDYTTAASHPEEDTNDTIHNGAIVNVDGNPPPPTVQNTAIVNNFHNVNDVTSSTSITSTPTPQGQDQGQVQVQVSSDERNKNRLHHLSTIPPTPKSHTNPIMQEYISTTQIYGCSNVNAGVLTAIRFSLPTLRVSGAFHDADMLALSEILFRHCNGALAHIKRLDFSVASREGKLHGKKGFGSHGAFTLSRVLCISKHIEEVFVQRNKIGPYGAASMFASAAKNATLRTLVMRRCMLGERGALAFAEYIGQSKITGLKEIDLSVNRIGFRGSIAIEEMLKERENTDGSIIVDLEGNLVLQEIMNGITHGLGIVLCIVGAMLLSNRVKNSGRNHVMSCGVYSISLLVLYTSSTLYHSFFALKYTRYIFEVFDHCAIYILITGSYTPFLRIALEGSPVASFYLIIFQWVCCCCGIFVEAFYNTWIHKPKFSLAMYLGMGWSCMICLPQFMEVLPKEAIRLLVLGGVGYTSGVPFFVRNNNLDHSIWHCFVLAGSVFHWYAVYEYVAPMTSSASCSDIVDKSMECLLSP